MLARAAEVSAGGGRWPLWPKGAASADGGPHWPVLTPPSPARSQGLDGGFRGRHDEVGLRESPPARQPAASLARTSPLQRSRRPPRFSLRQRSIRRPDETRRSSCISYISRPLARRSSPRTRSRQPAAAAAPPSRQRTERDSQALVFIFVFPAVAPRRSVARAAAVHPRLAPRLRACARLCACAGWAVGS